MKTAQLDRTAKINTLQDFTAWAEIVNTPQSNNFMCDLQDIYARSNPETIRAIFTDPAARAERRLLTFAVYKAMGEETFYDLIRFWAANHAEKIIDSAQADADRQHAERAAEITRRENAYNNARRAIYRKLRQTAQRAERAEQAAAADRARMQEYHADKATAQRRAAAAETDAEKYRQLKNLLREA